MNYEKLVLEAEPTAYLKVEKTIRVIVRPRRKEDGPALVKYVLMSDAAYTTEGAWKSAWEKLQTLESQRICQHSGKI